MLDKKVIEDRYAQAPQLLGPGAILNARRACIQCVHEPLRKQMQVVTHPITFERAQQNGGFGHGAPAASIQGSPTLNTTEPLIMVPF